MNSLFHPAPLMAAALAAAFAPAWAATPVFVNPTTPYLSSADIPAGFYAGGIPTLLDTLEDGALDASLSGSHGEVLSAAFAGIRDSVDADDGTLDGNCGPQSPGRCVSWFNGSGSEGVTFTFVGTGALPTAFGLVWTDGGAGATITFSAFGANGQSLGSISASGFADASNSGTTDEDRFFGVQFEEGILSIRITNNSGGIEVDHIQYGQMSAVPEPAHWALLAGGLGVLAWRRRVPR